MIPPPHHRHSSSSSSLMPLDLNQDYQNHEFFMTPNHHASSSSFSSISYPVLFNPLPDQDQQGSHCWELPNHSPNQEDQDEKIIVPSSGSWDNSAAEKHNSSSKLKLRVWKREERDDNHEAADHDHEGVKWMSSKMRIMRKMAVPDQRGTSNYAADGNSMQRFEDQKQPLYSPVGTDNSSTNNYSNQSNGTTVRVCADCNTTKTPLWRSGPRGPKTLCNACGIRQRKARRAMAAAAAAAASGNGTILVAADDDESSVKNRNKLQKKKEKMMMKKKKNKSKIECAAAPVVPQIKKKKRRANKLPSQANNKFGFEDLTMSLSKNLASLQQVFPQDEKEAAILLMALSYGLVHG